MFRVVVLPQPDGPSRVTNSPSAIWRSTSVDGGYRAEALRDPDQLDVCHQPLTAPSTKPWRMKRRKTTARTTTGMLARTAAASIWP